MCIPDYVAHISYLANVSPISTPYIYNQVSKHLLLLKPS